MLSLSAYKNVALHTFVNFEVECMSQRDWGWGCGCALWGWSEDGIQMYGDGTGAVFK